MGLLCLLHQTAPSHVCSLKPLPPPSELELPCTVPCSQPLHTVSPLLPPLCITLSLLPLQTFSMSFPEGEGEPSSTSTCVLFPSPPPPPPASLPCCLHSLDLHFQNLLCFFQYDFSKNIFPSPQPKNSSLKSTFFSSSNPRSLLPSQLPLTSCKAVSFFLSNFLFCK